MTTRSFLNSLLALALVGTATSAQAAGKKAPQQKAAAAAPGAQTLKVDTKSSVVKWVGSKAGGSSHNGTIGIKSGTIEVADNTLKGGTFEIDMKSIANEDLKSSPKDAAKLVGHLNSDDFFSTAKHPTATFAITGVKALTPAKAGDPTHEIMGDLTIKGKKLALKKPMMAVVLMTPNGAEATANLTFDRAAYDVRYGSGTFFDNLGDKLINDDVQMDVRIVATK